MLPEAPGLLTLAYVHSVLTSGLECAVRQARVSSRSGSQGLGFKVPEFQMGVLAVL